MYLPRRVSAQEELGTLPRGCLPRWRCLSCEFLPRGMFVQGVSTAHPHADTPNIATEAGGTHPTGMHSCFNLIHFLENLVKSYVGAPRTGILYSTC